MLQSLPFRSSLIVAEHEGSRRTRFRTAPCQPGEAVPLSAAGADWRLQLTTDPTYFARRRLRAKTAPWLARKVSGPLSGPCRRDGFRVMSRVAAVSGRNARAGSGPRPPRRLCRGEQTDSSGILRGVRCGRGYCIGEPKSGMSSHSPSRREEAWATMPGAL